MLGTHNRTDELDELVGMKITGWKEVQIDWGHSFVLLETDAKFDDNETVFLLLSQDAECNEGGYIGLVDKNYEKEFQYPFKEVS